jgi:hypothetical protein
VNDYPRTGRLRRADPALMINTLTN